MKEKDLAMAYIAKKLTENKFNSTEFTDKKTGAVITVVPFAYTADIQSIDEIEWYGMDCDKCNLFGEDTLSGVADAILHIGEKIDNYNQSVANLKEFFETKILIHKDDPEWRPAESHDFSMYSDWYKLLFNRRPRNFKFPEV